MKLDAVIYVGVGYLGAKETKRDSVYGTNLIWKHGQVHPVPSQIANQMAYKHPDVWALDDSERWKQFQDGTLQPETVPVQTVEKTVNELIDERVTQLAAALRACPKIDVVKAHDVVTQLQIVFPDDVTKRADIEAYILEKYRAYLLENIDKLQDA